MVSGAWAGASLVPVDEAPLPAADTAVQDVAASKAAPEPTPAAEPAEPSADVPAPPPDPSSLTAGQVLAGAAKTSIEPRPEDYDGTWEQRPEKCSTLSENFFTNAHGRPRRGGRPPCGHRLAVA